MEHFYGCPCNGAGPHVTHHFELKREVRPAISRRLEAAAVAAGVFGLAFWTYALLLT